MKKKILIIVGSATKNSSNLMIAKFAQEKLTQFEVEIIEDLAELPHFRTELTETNTPNNIVELREKIEQASGIIFSTPEYIFSIPSGLKNLLEWCVSTVVFSEKPIAITTASANGEKQMGKKVTKNYNSL